MVKNENMKDYELYLFDFDYTLADSSRGIVKCFRHVLEEAGHSGISDETIKRTIGLTLEEAFAEMTGVTDIDQLRKWRKEYVKIADKVMNAETELFPEVRELFLNLKDRKAKIGIISTKYRYRIENFLLDHFDEIPVDIIVGGEDVNSPKPSPEGVINAIRSLVVKKDRVLYCGDSVVDAKTAKNAGIDFAGVLHGVTPMQDLDTFENVGIVDNLLDLLN